MDSKTKSKLINVVAADIGSSSNDKVRKNNNEVFSYFFEDLKIGDMAEIKRKIFYSDICKFAEISRDFNQVHLDVDYAKKIGFCNVIAQGMWCGVMLSAVLGSKLPGRGTIYLSQTLDFKSPIYLEDTILARVTIKNKDTLNKKIVLDCQCLNQHGTVVTIGEAAVLPPMRKF